MNTSAGARVSKRNIACDECKRRKVRCNAQSQCSNCTRDNKKCTYSSPGDSFRGVCKPKQHQTAWITNSHPRSVRRYELLLKSIKKAWHLYVPNTPLEQALQHVDSTSPAAAIPVLAQEPPFEQHSSDSTNSRPTAVGDTSDQQLDYTDYGSSEHHNPDDFEFDESLDYGDAIDGMALLTLEPFRAGYTGPQSGAAALKILQSLPAMAPIDTVDDQVQPLGLSPQHSACQPDSDAFVNDYFQLYHPSYPLLHEGTFRARLSGALAKPKDGSWPLLYNMVLAIGAFSGDSYGGTHDLEHFRAAQESVSLSVIEKGSLSYVQGLTLMADYLQKRNKPNAAFALIGVAWSMGMAIGLHREFGPLGTTPFAMELRRRMWWNLYCFVSAAQLTLGRPPASLVGINVRVPINTDDNDLIVDMAALPAPKEGPSITSSLIAQVPLAVIANNVQTELLTNQVPQSDVVKRLDRSIEVWLAGLPAFFDPDRSVEWKYELPKRVLLWRSYHLRIVLNRPFLFQAVSQKAEFSASDTRIQKCITTADTCVDSIHRFLSTNSGWKRGFAWHATHWLISASFIHAICLAYSPLSDAADGWRLKVQQAIEALESLTFGHYVAERARKILQTFHDTSTASPTAQQNQSATLPQFMADNFGFANPNIDPTHMNGASWLNLQTHLEAPFALNGDADMLWQWSEASDAQFIDAVAGGSSLQEF